MTGECAGACPLAGTGTPVLVLCIAIAKHIHRKMVHVYHRDAVPVPALIHSVPPQCYGLRYCQRTNKGPTITIPQQRHRCCTRRPPTLNFRATMIDMLTGYASKVRTKVIGADACRVYKTVAMVHHQGNDDFPNPCPDWFMDGGSFPSFLP